MADGKALEIARREKVIGHSLEAEVQLKAEGDTLNFLRSEWQTVKEISIISELTFMEAETADVIFTSEELDGFVVAVQPASGDKCERCWIRAKSVGQNSVHTQLCARCSSVIAELGL